MNNKQRQFGNYSYPPKNSRGMANTERRVKTVLYLPGEEVKLMSFDNCEGRLAIVIDCIVKNDAKCDAGVIKHLNRMMLDIGEQDGNFWEAFIRYAVSDRVQTIRRKCERMNLCLTKFSYFSKSFFPMMRKFGIRRSNQDGVGKINLIMNEDEIVSICSTLIPGWNTKVEEHLQQTAIDIFTLGLCYGTRRNDIKTIIRSTDSSGRAVVKFGNSKGNKIQTIAFDPASEGALSRGLYTAKVDYRHDRALKVALRKILPTVSDRLVKYIVNRPAKGRVQLDDRRLNHVTFHTSRHSFATRWLKRGMSPQNVCKLMGHSSILTTMRYYSWLSEDDTNDALREARGENSKVIAPIPIKREFGKSIAIPQNNPVKGVIKEADTTELPPTKPDKVQMRAISEVDRKFKKQRMMALMARLEKEDGIKRKYGKAVQTIQ